MLIKHIAALVILTLIVLLAHGFIHSGFGLWMDLQSWLSNYLSEVFSNGGAGGWIKKILAFLAVPLVVTFVPAGIYWCMKRSTMPHIKEIFWSLWIIQTMIFILNPSFFGL
jgi:hypothetical protein